MALSPLTPEQQRAVGDLVAKGRISAVPSDLARALTFMRQAQDAITDLLNLTRPQNPHNRNQQRYDARPVGEAEAELAARTALPSLRPQSREASPNADFAGDSVWHGALRGGLVVRAGERGRRAGWGSALTGHARQIVSGSMTTGPIPPEAGRLVRRGQLRQVASRAPSAP